MKRSVVFVLTAALAGPVSAMAQQTDFGPLLSPAEAIEAVNSPLILDIRAPGTSDEPGYLQGHLPGAINAPYALFRGPKDNPGQVIPEDQLEQVLRQIGVTLDRPTLIVHQGSDPSDFGAAARVYWTLKSSGVSPLAILNGGVSAWKAEGLPLETDQVDPTPSQVEISFSNQWLATSDDVRHVVDGETKAVLLDARPESFWKGNQAHPAAVKPGTLPDSKLLTHSEWFDGRATIMDQVKATNLADDAGLAPDTEIVSFCNTGHWAATNWFALSELAGRENVKLYPDSMVGWSLDGNEMENVPGPFRNMMNQIKGVF